MGRSLCARETFPVRSCGDPSGFPERSLWAPGTLPHASRNAPKRFLYTPATFPVGCGGSPSVLSLSLRGPILVRVLTFHTWSLQELRAFARSLGLKSGWACTRLIVLISSLCNCAQIAAGDSSLSHSTLRLTPGGAILSPQRLMLQYPLLHAQLRQHSI